MSDPSAVTIRRLDPGDAPRVVDCFRRAYGDSYANELFYDATRLAERMGSGQVGCVGAVTGSGTVLGHMAMTRHPEATSVELGNTVVDPAARGQGLAWRIGAALTGWSVELGYRGYLHYPTTDHHVMQRQSVKAGFEVGLMLGYIPAETRAGMADHERHGRQAATIVYQALSPDAPEPALPVYLPAYGAELVRAFARDIGLARDWRTPEAAAIASSVITTARFEKRGLLRISVARVGADLRAQLEAALAPDHPASAARSWPCRQVDFSMADCAVDDGVEAARRLGFRFCGWLPGFASADVFRMQRADPSQTDLNPDLVNPVARALLPWCL
jgi:GNAT superfamily N-acetyltransferase